MHQSRISRREWIPILALYVLAFVVRLRFIDAHLWIDEAAVFYNARTGGQSPLNVFFYDSESPARVSTTWLFWQRPIHSILMTPAAMLGETGFRAWHIFLASLLAPAIVLLLRLEGVRTGFAYAAGCIVATIPAFVVFGVWAFPDAPMLLALLASMILRKCRYDTAAGLTILAAIGMKEIAYVALLAFLAPTALKVVRLWNRPDDFRFDRFETIALAAAAVGLWPLLLSWSLGAEFPGWYRGGSYAEILDRSLLVIWLLPLLIVSFFHARTRNYAAIGIAYPVFFLVFHATGRGVPLSYFMLSGALTLVPAAISLDHLWTIAQDSPGKRGLLAGCLVFITISCVTLVVLPHDHQVKQPLSSPVSAGTQTAPELGVSDWGLREWAAHLDSYRDGYWESVDFVRQNDVGAVFLVDAQWHDYYYPFPQSTRVVRLGSSDAISQDSALLQHFVNTLENRTEVTVLFNLDSNANLAIRSVYADCILVHNPDVTVLDGPRCSGRSAQLQMEVAAH